MSGTPFKMKGHTLPGPNQASPAKQDYYPPDATEREKRKIRKAAKKYEKADVLIEKYKKSGDEKYLSKAHKKVRKAHKKYRKAGVRGDSLGVYTPGMLKNM